MTAFEKWWADADNDGLLPAADRELAARAWDAGSERALHAIEGLATFAPYIRDAFSSAVRSLMANPEER